MTCGLRLCYLFFLKDDSVKYFKREENGFLVSWTAAVERVRSLSMFSSFRGLQVVHFPLCTRSHCGPSRGRFLIISTPHIEFHGAALFMHWKGERKKI